VRYIAATIVMAIAIFFLCVCIHYEISIGRWRDEAIILAVFVPAVCTVEITGRAAD